MTGDKINLNAREAAQALNISERTLWTKTKSGDVPHLKIGGRTLYPVSLLEKWVIDMATKTASKAG